jgi:N-carbamoylputrescine amidase
VDANIANAEKLVRQAAKQGAQIILIQELFETPYFCIEQDSRHLRIATTVADNRAINHFAKIARELEWCCPSVSSRRPTIPSSIPSRFSMPTARTSACIARRTSEWPGYQEKNYFSPATPVQGVGHEVLAHRCGICWDQWFPECARAMALMGAELLFYPDGDRQRAAAGLP